MIYTWTIEGQPVSMGRPRFSRRSSHCYTPRPTREWQAYAVAKILDSKPAEAIERPCQLSVIAVFHRPKIINGRKPHHPGRVRHGAKPDADNVLKQAGDCLERAGVLRNDSRIFDATVSKFYAAEGETPHTEIKLYVENEI